MALAVAAPAPAQVSWMLASPYRSGTPQAENLRQFVEDVLAASAGALRIQLQGVAQGDHAAAARAVTGGGAQAAAFQLATFESAGAVLGADAVPFLATNYHKAQKLWEAALPAVERRLRSKGLGLLLAVPGGPEGFFSRRTLSSAADLAGATVVVRDAPMRRMAELAKARPVAIADSGLAAAFAGGRADVLPATPSFGIDAEAWRYAEFYYHVHARAPRDAVVVSRKAFGGLDARVRDALLASAARARERGLRLVEKRTDSALDRLRDRGVSIHLPDATLRVGLAELGRKLTFQWSERAGDDAIPIIERYYAF
jgi:TRAP-type C4-dicarboxylate transport system substrate-binding protein